MSTQDLHHLSIAALAAQIRNRHTSATGVAQHFLQRAKAQQALGAFLALDEDITLAQAQAPDAALAAGQAGPLAGVPIGHTDVFVTRDFPTTASSRMLAGYRSPFDATVVTRLAEAGCVTLGKLSCDEFAMGNGNESAAIAPVGMDAPAPVRNPWDTQRVPGGSSGGSAAAVAARMVAAATGTDTGGSIRQPASFCGITGIKPTYGRASRYGMIAYASSLDQAGPMAHSAEDCALLLSVMCGPDTERDATSLDVPAENFTRQLGDSIEGLRIGVPAQFFADGLADDVRTAIDAALKEYEKLGATLVPVQLPRTQLSVPAYYIISPAEASSNLSRFDGVRYGHRTANPVDLQDLYKKSRAEAFGDEVQRRIMIGAYVLSEGYYDAYYLQAQKIRRLIANDFQAASKDCDVIAGPVAPSVAWQLGDKADPLASYLADVFTLPASLAGLPAMSLPVGWGAHQMPVGLQLIGNYLQEGRLLNVAHRFQQVTDFHQAEPKSI